MTNNKQQTAVEWFIQELQKTRDYQRVINEANQSTSAVRDVVEQAKEMEKKQRIKDKLELSASLVKNKEQQHETTWIAALDYGIEKMKGLNDLESKDAFEQYYEQTYGGSK
jgi:DNA mismatch repair ATPase MutS